ncbi:MAG: CPBP family glutamic-type intramembrane protease [Cytophagales bacterium]|nr:CPBP family glutamic-type intramembrane protease [Cytophagales bacterium]
MKYPLVKPTYYVSLFRDLFHFVKKPSLEEQAEKSTRLKIYDTIGLFIVKMICMIPVILFFALIYDPENVQKASMSERFTPIMMLLVGGFILPLVEEVAFRLSLRFKPIYLSLSLSVFLYYVLTKLIFDTKISAMDESFILRTGVSFGFGLLLFPLFNYRKIKAVLNNFWETNFRWIYYISSLVFAWIHLAKYEIILLNVLLLPILTLPQLMSALINGYTRVKFGFQYPLLFHMANNVIAVGLSLLT